MSNNPRNIIENTIYVPSENEGRGVWKPWENLQSEYTNIWPIFKIEIECLVVAAGGGSGGGGLVGGGGAGGIFYGTIDVALEEYTVIIGAGTAAAAGSDSSLIRSLDSSIAVRALGGGRGGVGAGGAGQNGGSGGGGGPVSGQGGTASQPTSTWGGFGGNGFNSTVSGLYSSRGGGAGPNGWDGRLFDISGTATYYGGGGGFARPPLQGGGELVKALGGGGWGGGGSGPGGLATAGDPNTGGGAGGTVDATILAGGSGIVIIRHPTRANPAITTGSVSSSIVGSDSVYIFTGSGSITFV